ncbi:MAG: transketolase [Candidatus Omnitrophica bacterium]|nr:transketolase [Candidatus Omnitrophota bacterium]MDD5081031.1 transketolase [Candidatus Omnitrophota bacterium]MDD5441349.1 transketolase [Candidatus Omnitrophota bacterium]
MNYRKEILSNLVPYFRNNDKLFLIVCDMGFGVVDELKKEFPDRVINAGIMEQATVGIAAGMSMQGFVPIVYSIVNFLVYRAIEQMRNDVILQNLNVKFIGNGVNDYFKMLGESHMSGCDDIKLMEIIGMQVYDPYKAGVDFSKLMAEWIDSPKAGYIRV